MTTATDPVAELLSRLDDVRHRGEGRWSARCPAHADSTPSLSVGQRDDGAVLLYCFAGCTVEEVCAALGLDVAALFVRDRDGGPPSRRRHVDRDWYPMIAHECLVVAVAASDVSSGKTLTEADTQRLWQAVTTLRNASDEFSGRRHRHAGNK